MANLEVFKLSWPMAEPLVLNKRRYDRYKNKAGKPLPSVTGILGNLGWNKNVLNKWANNIGLQGIPISEYKAEADCGSIAHYYSECFIKQRRPDLTQLPQATAEEKKKLDDIIPRAQNAFLGFLDWEKAVKPTWIGSEVKLMSEKNQYGGTLDVMAQIGNALTLIDLKSSKGVYSDFIIQVAAYRELARENGYHVDSVMILQLGKEDGIFIPHPIGEDQLRVAFHQVFIPLLVVHGVRKTLDRFVASEE